MIQGLYALWGSLVIKWSQENKKTSRFCAPSNHLHFSYILLLFFKDYTAAKHGQDMNLISAWLYFRKQNTQLVQAEDNEWAEFDTPVLVLIHRTNVISVHTVKFKPDFLGLFVISMACWMDHTDFVCVYLAAHETAKQQLTA